MSTAAAPTSAPTNEPASTTLLGRIIELTTRVGPSWFRLAFWFFRHTVPPLIDQRRRKRLKEITGELKPGYFRLSPREDEGGFTRADNKHEEVFWWLKARRTPVLYLTGQSGSG